MAVKNLLNDLIAFLVTNGLVTKAGTDAFADTMPISPDNAVALFEYHGAPAFLGDFANRSVSVQVRGMSYENVRIKAQAIYNLFHKELPEDRMMMITAERWSIIHCRSTPYKLSTDESGRTTFVFSMGVLTYKDE